MNFISKRLSPPVLKVSVLGFTLMEVAVALLILSMVLASSLQLVGQYADERVLMRERFLANRVAWNRLLEKYQELEGWHSRGLLTTRRKEGSEIQGGTDWQWKLGVEEAMGQQLYRFEATVVKGSKKRPSSALAVFLIDDSRRE
ncbi:MAG: type II secretion system protein GspI [Cellvibrionales bacterium TMED49]|nr:type II secretion system protein GspI [Porticoccaceae bacterium]OUU40094.1 MAG: type II secretion system protein GspI [Cellvibrionales bacterium TMED49]